HVPSVSSKSVPGPTSTRAHAPIGVTSPHVAVSQLSGSAACTNAASTVSEPSAPSMKLLTYTFDSEEITGELTTPPQRQALQPTTAHTATAPPSSIQAPTRPSPSAERAPPHPPQACRRPTARTAAGPCRTPA